MDKIKVLVSPLDWGLGHATRCVPLLRWLVDHGYEVLLGTTEGQRAFFQKEFPQVPQLEAPSYAITYPSSGWRMPFWLLSEIPRLWKVQKLEQKWVEEVRKMHGIRLVISDNRFGCFSPLIPSVYITHQLRIALPKYVRIFEPLLEAFHGWLQRNFTEVWVPDSLGALNLAGRLSQRPLRKKVHYIGSQTRFTACKSTHKKWDWCVLLSGPEPQRSLLESLACQALLNPEVGQVLLVRGKPGEMQTPDLPAHFTVYNHLPSDELQDQICQSHWVLCRSGYSTLMDLEKLGAKAILVPTPGQTEQVVLAQDLSHKKTCAMIEQHCLNWSQLSLARDRVNGFVSQRSEADLSVHFQRIFKHIPEVDDE